MRPQDRDELLVRVDEKTKYIADLSEKQEKHLASLNDKVATNVVNLAKHNERIKNIELSSNLRLTRPQLAIGGGGIVTILATLLLTLAKAMGWF